MFMTLINPLSAIEKKKVELKWRRIPEAIYYLLEVQDEKENIVESIKTKKNKINLYLKPGEYKKRLTIYNKLGEIDTQSDWKSLKVIQVFEPKVIKPKKIILEKGRKNPPIIIKGKHFEEDIEIYFQSIDYRIFANNTITKSDSEIKITKDLSDLPSGVYQLKLKNPHSKEVVYPNFLIIKERGTTTKPDKQQEIASSKNWEIVKRSALFPGWGQYYAGESYRTNSHKYRGIVYASLFVLSGFYTYKTYLDYTNKENSLKNNARYFLARNIAFSSDLRRVSILDGMHQLKRSSSKLNKLNNKHQEAKYLMLGIYLIQLIDAIILQDEYSEKEEASNGFKVEINYNPIVRNQEEIILENQYNLYYKFYF